MPGFATVLPLAIVMVAGPQIITAVFLATSENWRKNSGSSPSRSQESPTSVLCVITTMTRPR